MKCGSKYRFHTHTAGKKIINLYTHIIIETSDNYNSFYKNFLKKILRKTIDKSRCLWYRIKMNPDDIIICRGLIMCFTYICLIFGKSGRSYFKGIPDSIFDAFFANIDDRMRYAVRCVR